MRLYTFNNMYLSSLQNGLQSAHVTAELFTKYPDVEWTANGSPNQHLFDWACNHKTMILLNGGYLETIQDLWTFLDDEDNNPYPYAKFHEGEDSLGGIMTSIGVVLPEKIYLMAAAIRRDRPHRGEKSLAETIQDNGKLIVFPENEYGFVFDDGVDYREYEFSKWEFDLMNRLNGFRLAS